MALRTSSLLLLILAAACGKQATAGGGGGDGGGGGGGGAGGSGGGGGMASCSECVAAGGTCTNGVCAPIKVLAAGDIDARGPLVLDSGELYFTTASPVCNVNATCRFVDKCPVTGCADGTVVGEPGYAPIAVGSGTLYFQGTADVRSCATSSQCINSAATVASQRPLALAVDGNGVYFVSGANVLKCPLTGCGGAPPMTLATITGQPATTLAADGTRLFFASDTQIFSVPDDGSAAATPLVAVDGVTALALDADNVYYGSSSFRVGSCPKSGCAQPTELATTPAVTALATDGAEVYWGTKGGIFRCPATPPCTPTEVASEYTTSIYGLALDSHFVYYTNGSIWKLVR